jgi:ribosomal protein S19
MKKITLTQGLLIGLIATQIPNGISHAVPLVQNGSQWIATTLAALQQENEIGKIVRKECSQSARERLQKRSQSWYENEYRDHQLAMRTQAERIKTGRRSGIVFPDNNPLLEGVKIVNGKPFVDLETRKECEAHVRGDWQTYRDEGARHIRP